MIVSVMSGGKETNHYWMPTVYQIEPVMRYAASHSFQREDKGFLLLNGKVQQKHTGMSPDLFYIRYSLWKHWYLFVLQNLGGIISWGCPFHPFCSLGLKDEVAHLQDKGEMTDTWRKSFVTGDAISLQKEEHDTTSPVPVAFPKLAQASACTISP